MQHAFLIIQFLESSNLEKSYFREEKVSQNVVTDRVCVNNYHCAGEQKVLAKQ